MVKVRIWSDGDKTWFLNNIYHRVNGPAIVWHRNGTISWYWHGRKLTEYEIMMVA